MKKILLNIAVKILRLIYIPLKKLKIKDKIVYISRQSNAENLDFKLIRERIEKEYPQYQNVVLTRKIEPGVKNKMDYIVNIIKQMYHIATSKIVILDTYCITASVLKHKKETKIIQIWHAPGAIKKFGYQSIDKPSGTKKEIAEIMCMHQNYNYVLAPSKETAKSYKEAFNVKEEQIKYIAMPRLEYVMQEDKVKSEKIYNQYPELRNKTNILYVPTFRKGEKIQIDELIKKIDTKKYNLIVKLHPLDLKEYECIEKEGIIYEKKYRAYDLIKIADKLITDYSSLAMEAGMLDMPVYFYTYDIDKYKYDPGLNFDFEKEEVGKYQTENVQELLNFIEEEYDYDALKKFKQKYIEVPINGCVDKLIEFIMRLMKNEKIENIDDRFIKEKYSTQKRN